MSRNGSIELEFGGETRTFRLALGELEQVQERCGEGPQVLAARMAPWLIFAQEREAAEDAGVVQPSLLQGAAAGRLGSWRVHDVREPILRGLQGGGLSPNAAAALVRQFVDGRPLLESVPTAFAVLMAAVIGVEDERPAGESEAAPEAAAA